MTPDNEKEFLEWLNKNIEAERELYERMPHGSTSAAQAIAILKRVREKFLTLTPNT